MDNHEVVSRDEWIKARKQLLAKEKEFTRLRDQLGQQRRDLPWNASIRSMSSTDQPGRKRCRSCLPGSRS